MESFVTGEFIPLKATTNLHYSGYKKVTKKALFFVIK